MDYIMQNKEAWEEAFDHKIEGWGNNVVENIQVQPDYYIHPAIKCELDKLSLRNKQVAQFCCNNGRELLSVSSYHDTDCTGFDIASNLIDQAKLFSKELELNCKFVSENILEISDDYSKQFDLVFFTIGAITWFKNLDDLFQVVSMCLKEDGIMLIHDFHPVMNMLPLPGEDSYNPKLAQLLPNTYFMKDPWIENSGMGYISGEYDSKTFTSFSHSISSIINNAISNDLEIVSLDEYDYDVGLTDGYNNQGLPLSMLMVARKK